MNYKLVKIKWVDSSFSSLGWKRLKDNSWSLVKFWTVGYIIKETKKFIVIVQSIEITKESNKQISSDIVIPKCSVLKIKYL